MKDHSKHIHSRDLDEWIIEQFVGKQLSRRRLELGITLERAAQKIDILPEELKEYEEGKASLPARLLGQLSLYYRVNPEYFFDLLPEGDSKYAY